MHSFVDCSGHGLAVS